MFQLLELSTKAGCRLSQDLKFSNIFTGIHPDGINSTTVSGHLFVQVFAGIKVEG